MLLIYHMLYIASATRLVGPHTVAVTILRTCAALCSLTRHMYRSVGLITVWHDNRLGLPESHPGTRWSSSIVIMCADVVWSLYLQSVL